MVVCNSVVRSEYSIISEFVVDPEMLEKLTVGFLSHCLPDLQKAKGALAEIL